MTDLPETTGLIPYESFAMEALRAVVRDTLCFVVQSGGFPGEQHAFITFSVDCAGVVYPAYGPQDSNGLATIILQNRFWNLDVDEKSFSVDLSFGGVEAKITVPWAAVVRYYDPVAQFALMFPLEPSQPREAKDPRHGLRLVGAGDAA